MMEFCSTQTQSSHPGSFVGADSTSLQMYADAQQMLRNADKIALHLRHTLQVIYFRSWQHRQQNGLLQSNANLLDSTRPKTNIHAADANNSEAGSLH